MHRGRGLRVAGLSRLPRRVLLGGVLRLGGRCGRRRHRRPGDPSSPVGGRAPGVPRGDRGRSIRCPRARSDSRGGARSPTSRRGRRARAESRCAALAPAEDPWDDLAARHGAGCLDLEDWLEDHRSDRSATSAALEPCVDGREIRYREADCLRALAGLDRDRAVAFLRADDRRGWGLSSTLNRYARTLLRFPATGELEARMGSLGLLPARREAPIEPRPRGGPAGGGPRAPRAAAAVQPRLPGSLLRARASPLPSRPARVPRARRPRDRRALAEAGERSISAPGAERFRPRCEASR